MKILIADDDLTSRVMLEGLTRKWGFDPVVAEDGQAAWDIIQGKDAPKLLLLDWEMPLLNGIQLCELIRESENNTNDPSFIILLTSRNETSDIVKGLSAGSNEYIVKPFAHAELQARLNVGFRMLQLQAERKEHEQDLLLFKRAFYTSMAGTIITDDQEIIINVNSAFCDVTGFEQGDVVGQKQSYFISDQEKPTFHSGLLKKLERLGQWRGEILGRKKNGDVYTAQALVSILKNERDEIVNYVGTFTDITQQKKHQEKLDLLAHHDVLTGLPNRALFIDRFKQSIAHSKRTKRLLAVSFLDLDNFKPVNDTYGHDVGDKLLIEVTKRLSENIREEDTISRQGGDEFTILLGSITSTSECMEMMGRIHDSISVPYLIDNHVINIGSSSGVTLYPLDDNDLDTLIRHADKAMYHAKTHGKNYCHLFNVEDGI